MIGNTLLGARVPQSMAGMPADTPILLAFSGGADSTALLHWLNEQKKLYGFSMILAHVNHGIRGEEALRDRSFCEACAKRYDLEICVLDTDVPRLARERGRGIEEMAREVRYEYFERLMRERHIPLLVTAHHADDQLETVLFRLARGTGIKGLCGIPPTHSFANGMIARPFLHVTRQEIIEYCRSCELEFVTDSTNVDPAYTRNRIRMEILPVMESLFPGASQRAARTTEELLEITDYIDEAARSLLRNAKRDTGISSGVLIEAPLPIRKRALCLWAERACGGMVEAVHLDALHALCLSKKPFAQIALPHDTVAFCNGDVLMVGKKQCNEIRKRIQRIPLSPGVCDVGVTGIRVFAEKCENGIKVHNLSTTPYIILKEDFAIISKTLFWRMRQEGDVILMGGMHRKLRRLQAQAQIPARLREDIPLLCDADGIVWAPFVGVRDGVVYTCDPTADGVMVGVFLSGL